MCAVLVKFVSFFMAILTAVFPGLFLDKSDLVVELAANPTTGYSWVCEIEDESVIKLTATKYESDDNTGKIIGAGGTQYFYFTALSEGKTGIVFTYLQNWEGGSIARTIVYSVTVDSNLNVTYKTISL